LFGGRTPAKRVAIYAVSGGVPAYLELFTRTDTFVTALHDHCLGPGSIMLTDPALILHEQLREPQTFASILSVIASGFHRWGEIARMSGVTENSLGHYLNILQELELIERRDPVLSRPGGRRGLYHVRDHFLRFYYRSIAPHITAIERGYLATAVNRIHEDLRTFIGTYVFEELCREWVWAAAALGEVEFQPEVVGAYWRRHRGKGVQLDEGGKALGSLIINVITATTFVVQIVGPICVKFAIGRAGEIGRASLEHDGGAGGGERT